MTDTLTADAIKDDRRAWPWEKSARRLDQRAGRIERGYGDIANV